MEHSVDACRSASAVDPVCGHHAAEKNLQKGTAQATAGSPRSGTIYTCPMHPQIRQVGPGNCPICGMTLEPVKATADVGENHELADMTRRFWVGLVLTLPVFVLEMGGHIPALGLRQSGPAAHLQLDSIRSVDAGRLVGRMAVLRTRLGVGRAPQPEHVQPDRAGDGRRLPLQPLCDLCAGTVSRRLPRDGRHGLRLLRSRRGDHRSGIAGPGAGTARPRADRRRDPRLAQTGAQDSAPLEGWRRG